MDITNFSNIIRVGSNFPSTIDITRISDHETSGVMAMCFTYRSKDKQAFLQFRQQNHHNRVCLFAFAYNDMTVPKDWEDSTIIWDSRKESPCDPTAPK